MPGRKNRLLRQSAVARTALSVIPPFAVAMKRTLAQGYGWSRFRADLLAGVVVGIVALPLSMALAIAVGAPPQHGLYTAIVAGAVVALTGGSKHQVTGPTAAFVVILAPIVTKQGLFGLLTAGMMAGALLIVMGVMRFGRFMQFIPHPVTTGFTAGIATVIATLQLKDALGLPVPKMPDSYTEKILALWSARHDFSPTEFGVAAITLALLIGLPRFTRKWPPQLIAIVTVSAGAALAHRFVPTFHVATIGSRFHSMVNGIEVAGIPPLPPLPMLPWGGGDLSWAAVRELVGPAFAIAMLGAIESLLSAVIADGMTGKRHDPDAELIGLGIGNLIAPFFGGIAATGALARTATNIRAGATSPIASVIHAAFILLTILIAAPLVAYVPMAALAGLLLLVAWNMSELKHFVHTVRVAPRSDVFVLLTCYVLTVLFDMVMAIGVGVVLAALLFMRRMSELTSTRILSDEGSAQDTSRRLPQGVTVYEIAGPLFFGAAAQAMRMFETVGTSARVIVLALGNVPVIDATGLVALESALHRLEEAKKLVIIAGPLPSPQSVFERAHLEDHHDNVFVAPTLDDAIQLGRDLIVLTPDAPQKPPGSSAASAA